ncbi:MAG: GNAT family N-acetyltransferase, partial [Candidatus Omnitrophica bacterium]|nr:GNAT family N-acetyltransferase [Candidatus Omnitrophota bacterium]
RHAYQLIESSVCNKAGKEHFLGVTVQPMIKSDGYEIIIGSSIDEQFGPVLLFGSGGQLVEVFKDRALALPPLNTTLARRMIEQTHIFTALKGVRGRPPVDIAGIEQILVLFSQLVVEQRWIKEIDINPLIASPDRVLALDARVVVYGKDVSESQLPKLAVRPYPTQYVTSWIMKDGTSFTIRPIRPEDEPLLAKFHETLSDRSVYLRYAHMMKLGYRVAHERLTRICFIDYTRDMALVADRVNPENGAREILGVGRLSKLHGKNEAEFAVLVSDEFQQRGLGSELVRRLIDVGKDEKLRRIIAYILPENNLMQAICKKLGFKLQTMPDEPLVKAEINI